MRTKIVLAALVLLIGGFIGVGVAAQQQKYKQEQAQLAQVQTDKQSERDIAHKVEINSWAGRYEALKAECQKGLAAYGLLTSPIKSKTAEPNCNIGQ
jgi:hypothetical protein